MRTNDSQNTRLARLHRTQAFPSQGDQSQAVGRIFERLLLENYTPASVLINEAGEILYFSGPTNLFLRHPLGSTSNNVFDLTHGNLHIELRAAILNASQQKRQIVREGVSFEIDGITRTVDLVARHVSELGADPVLFAVIFREKPQPALPPEPATTSISEQSLVQHLENELRIAREDLEAILDELGSSNQELTDLKLVEQQLRASEERYRSLFHSMTEGFALHEIVCDKSGVPIDYVFLEVNPAFERFTGWTRDQVVGKRITELLPNESSFWVKLYGDVALSGASSDSETYSPALKRHYHIHAYSPAIGQFAVIFVDITEKKYSQESLRHRSEELERVLEALPALVWIAHDPECREITGNRAANEFLGTAPGTNLSQTAGPEGNAVVLDQYKIDGNPYHPEELPLQRAIATAQPIFGAEIEFRFKDGAREWVFGNALPLFDSKGKVRGGVAAFTVITHQKHLQTELERRVHERTAQLSVVNTSLGKEIHQRKEAEEAHRQVLIRLNDAQEVERGRISRELHDQLGQELTSLKLQLSMAAKKPALPAETHSSLSQLIQLSDTIMQSVHRLAVELRPIALDDLGLEAVLDRSCKDWSAKTGINIVFYSQGMSAQRLNKEIETAIFRITQEALTNMARHSKASRASVLLERRPHQLSLIIEDDGVGFDVEAVLGSCAPKQKLGLLGMRERALIVGGEVELESTPNGGTTLFVRVPLPEL